MSNELLNKLIASYKDKYNYDLSHMKLELGDQPTFSNGKPATIPLDKWGGNWVNDGRILINKNLEPVAKFYKFKGSIDDLKKRLIAHELAHEIEAKLADKKFKQKIINQANKEKFTTEYLDTLDKDQKQFDKELFCEYLASKQASSIYNKGIGSVVRRKNNNGLIEKGNIDIYNRPKVKLPNGDIATVRTISVGNKDGYEVLIPTISDDGKVLSNEAAIDLWKRTGKHLGIYKDVASANKAGQLLHKQQEDYYLKR